MVREGQSDDKEVLVVFIFPLHANTGRFVLDVCMSHWCEMFFYLYFSYEKGAEFLYVHWSSERLY